MNKENHIFFEIKEMLLKENINKNEIESLANITYYRFLKENEYFNGRFDILRLFQEKDGEIKIILKKQDDKKIKTINSSVFIDSSFVFENDGELILNNSDIYMFNEMLNILEESKNIDELIKKTNIKKNELYQYNYITRKDNKSIFNVNKDIFENISCFLKDNNEEIKEKYKIDINIESNSNKLLDNTIFFRFAMNNNMNMDNLFDYYSYENAQNKKHHSDYIKKYYEYNFFKPEKLITKLKIKKILKEGLVENDFLLIEKNKIDNILKKIKNKYILKNIKNVSSDIINDKCGFFKLKENYECYDHFIPFDENNNFKNFNGIYKRDIESYLNNQETFFVHNNLEVTSIIRFTKDDNSLTINSFNTIDLKDIDILLDKIKESLNKKIKTINIDILSKKYKSKEKREMINLNKLYLKLEEKFGDKLIQVKMDYCKEKDSDGSFVIVDDNYYYKEKKYKFLQEVKRNIKEEKINNAIKIINLSKEEFDKNLKNEMDEKVYFIREKEIIDKLKKIKTEKPNERNRKII